MDLKTQLSVRGGARVDPPLRTSGGKTMRVQAKNEEVAKALNLTCGRIGRLKFNSEGVAEWPDDSFTRRRLRDGDITVVEDKQIAPPRRARSETTT